MSVRASEPSDELRVLLCFTFDHRAPPSEVDAFKRRLIDAESTVHSVEVSGTFDFIAEEKVPDLVTYHRRHAALAGDIARLVKRYEACFVCKRFIRQDDEVFDCLWITQRDGLRRIPCDKIDKITAEGDYVRLHFDRTSCLHHVTMAKLERDLDPNHFVRLHRSVIVRMDFIAGLLHQGNGWFARLADGTEQRVAKSHASEVLQRVRKNSAITRATSATMVQLEDAR